jgi:cellulose synthase/poly-beta-1,6-N-acetylglucosamine synthase-like glycosyltransferase
MKQEKRWIALFYVLVSLWIISVASTLDQWIFGITPLVDTNINLFYITLPLLSIYLFYFLVSIFIFCIYLLGYNKVKNYQMRKITESRNHLKLYPGNEKIFQSFDMSTRNSNYAFNDLCSIIIPSRNEENVIGNTVRHCLLQTYQNIEVIVICHNCDDRTFSEAQVQDSRVKAIDFRTKATGKGVALNEGVKMANGKYILILDSDAMLSRDFIETAIPLFDDNYAAVQGRYVPSNRDYNFVTKLLALEGDLWSTSYMTARSLLSKEVFLGGTGYIIRTDILSEVGDFTNHLVDDFELSCRLLKKKHKIAFAPLSIDYDEKPPTFDIMIRQRARWAKGFLSLLKKRVLRPSDILGNIYWLGPLATLSSLLILVIAAYNAIYNILFGYYPYLYAFVPLHLWFLLIGSIMSMQCLVLVKQYGILKGLKRAAYLPAYNLFSIYAFAALLKAFFVRSWQNTKTLHGFVTDKEREQIESVERKV